LIVAINAFRQQCGSIRERTVIPDNSFDRRLSAWDLIVAINAFRQQCGSIRERTVIPDNSFDRRLSR
jgi:hypothetical protein